VLETLNPTRPRLISLLDLKEQFDQIDAINTLIASGQHGYIGLTGSTGPDMIMVDLSNLASLKIIGQIGTQGAGEHIAVNGSDIVIGSAKNGLHYVQAQGGTFNVKNTWPINIASAACSEFMPTLPQPLNASEVNGDSVTLAWNSACPADHYELHLNSDTVRLDKPTYVSTSVVGRNTWQVIAVDANGQRHEGPIWSFDRVSEGWASSPVHINNVKMLYTPPLATVNLNDPKLAQPLLCGALILSILLIVIAAWWLGQRADAQRNRYL
jgi:hypothetical protein